MPLRGTNSRGPVIADRLPQIEPAPNLVPLVRRRSTRRAGLMTLSLGGHASLMTSSLCFGDAFGAHLPRLGCPVPPEVFEIAADTSETGTFDTTSNSR